MNIELEGGIEERFLEFIQMCVNLNKTVEQRIQELMLGDLLMYQKIRDGNIKELRSPPKGGTSGWK